MTNHERLTPQEESLTKALWRANDRIKTLQSKVEELEGKYAQAVEELRAALTPSSNPNGDNPNG
jgi:hypothetical protein